MKLQQAIYWANVDPDPCRHMISVGRNVFTYHGIYPEKHISALLVQWDTKRDYKM